VELLPAIDLRRGEVVRLRQGRPDSSRVYDADLGAALAEYARSGVRRVHVVDLDAAFGETSQRPLLERVLATRDRPAVQLGGGLRSEEAIVWALGAGCERAVVGSLVARDPYVFAELAERFPLRLVPALDIERGVVRISGWTSDAALGVDDLCGSIRGLPCAAVVVTDIERDGTLAGANIGLAREVARRCDLPALLSGGIGTLDDLRAAARVPEIAGAIVGKALWEGSFTLGEALVACRRPEVGAP
jgi:phosphoribosylformimino-5-aminoimidazole carboxamide ribotide isomerase